MAQGGQTKDRIKQQTEIHFSADRQHVANEMTELTLYLTPNVPLS